MKEWQFVEFWEKRLVGKFAIKVPALVLQSQTTLPCLFSIDIKQVTLMPVCKTICVSFIRAHMLLATNEQGDAISVYITNINVIPSSGITVFGCLDPLKLAEPNDFFNFILSDVNSVIY